MCLMCMSQVSLNWNTSAGWRPSCFLASWSEADEIMWPWPCPSVELLDCLLPGQPSTHMRSAWKTTPNNFLLSEASNLKTFLLGELRRSSFWFYFPSYATMTWFSITKQLYFAEMLPLSGSQCCQDVQSMYLTSNRCINTFVCIYTYLCA